MNSIQCISVRILEIDVEVSRIDDYAAKNNHHCVLSAKYWGKKKIIILV